MDKILDEEKPQLKKSVLQKYKMTPFLIIGWILKLISTLAIIPAIFNELIGKGSKGTITVIIIALIVFVVTHLVLILERELITEENKRSIIIGEIIMILMILGRLYSL